MHHAKKRLCLDFKSDHHAVKRHVMNESICAVDRIQNPPAPRSAWLLASFFTQDGIIWKDLIDRLAQVPFSFAIRHRNKRVVSLPLRYKRSLVMTPDDFACLARDVDGEVQESLEFVRDLGHSVTFSDAFNELAPQAG